MLLNSGLDNMALYPYEEFGGRGFGAFIEFAAVGTGATPPTAADTALVNEVARSRRTSWVAHDGSAGVVYYKTDHNDALNDYLSLVQQFERMFVFRDAHSLSEFGLAPAGGLFSVRDLFRVDPGDDESSPVVVSVEAGDHLHLRFDLELRVPWVDAAPVSFDSSGGVTGSGLGGVAIREGALTAMSYYSGYPNYTYGLDVALGDVFVSRWPAGGGGFVPHSTLYRGVSSPDKLVSDGEDWGHGHTGTNDYSYYQPYTPGSYERTYVSAGYVFDSNDFPITIRMLYAAGCRVILDSPFIIDAVYDPDSSAVVEWPFVEFEFTLEWGRL